MLDTGFGYNDVYVEGLVVSENDALRQPTEDLRLLTVIWGNQAAQAETNLRTELFHWDEPTSAEDAIEGAITRQLPGVWFPGRLVVDTNRGPVGEPFAGTRDDDDEEGY